MDKKIIEQNANNIMWVEYWMKQAHPSHRDYEFSADRIDKDKWLCDIELPLTGTKLRTIAETESKAIIDTANRAARLINRYMADHPETKIDNPFKGKQYSIKIDENGRVDSYGISSKWRREEGSKQETKISKMIELANKFSNSISNEYGRKDDLFITILSHTLFDENMTITDIMNSIDEKLNESFDHSSHIISYNEKNGTFVVIGNK